MSKKTVVIILSAVVALVLAWMWSRQSQNGDLIIGSVVPMTGSAAEYGAYNREASELFVEEFNRRHPNGPRLRHMLQDSKSKPRDGVSAVQSLLTNSNLIAIQVQLSGISIAVAPIVLERGLPLLTIAGTARAKDLNPRAYRNYPNPVFIADQTARRFLRDTTGTDRVAILWSNDEFGRSLKSAFETTSSEIGVNLVTAESFEPGAANFRGTVSRVISNRPTIVYLAGVGNPLGRIILQLRELGFDGLVLGGPEIAFSNVLSIAGDAAEGVNFLDLAFDLDSDRIETRNFVRRYREKFNRDPTAVSAVVYDGWSILLEAVDKAGGANANSVTDVLSSIDHFEGVVGTLRVSPARDIVYPLTARVIHEGQPIVLD